MKGFFSTIITLVLATSIFSQTITVGSTSLQTWRGFEAVAQSGHELNATTDAYQYPSLTFDNYEASLRTNMLDVGINRLRVEVYFDDETTDAYTSDSHRVAANDNGDANVINAAGFGTQRLDHQMNDVVIPYRNALLAQGETLWINLCFVDFRSAGFQAEDTPAEVAEFAYFWVDYMSDTWGITPDSLELILEPDAGENSGEWTTAKIANNVVEANTRLNNNGYPGIPWVLPSNTNGTTVAADYASIKTTQSSVATIADEISYHRYTSPNNTQLATLRDAAEADGNCIAMLEWIGATYLTLWDDIETGRGCSWEQFATAFPWSGQADTGEAYFQVNRTTWVVSLGTRTQYLRSFSKYVRRGAVGKSVTNSNSNFRGLPFTNTNGKVVVPVRALTNGTVNVTGLPNGTYGRCVTIGNGTDAPTTYNSCSSDVVVTSPSDNVPLTFSGAGVGTVYDINYLQSGSVIKSKLGNARVKNARL